jgi:DNA-directed RNA polymerase subunit RPC12/RpoP
MSSYSYACECGAIVTVDSNVNLSGLICPKCNQSNKIKVKYPSDSEGKHKYAFEEKGDKKSNV